MYLHKFILGTVIALLCACSVIQSVPDAIGSGYVAIETLANQAAETESLTAEQRADIRIRLEAAKDHLDTATELYGIGATTESGNRLQLAVTILTVVEEILRNVET